MLLAVLLGVIVFTICFFTVGLKKAAVAGTITTAIGAVALTIVNLVLIFQAF